MACKKGLSAKESERSPNTPRTHPAVILAHLPCLYGKSMKILCDFSQVAIRQIKSGRGRYKTCPYRFTLKAILNREVEGAKKAPYKSVLRIP